MAQNEHKLFQILSTRFDATLWFGRESHVGSSGTSGGAHILADRKDDTQYVIYISRNSALESERKICPRLRI